MCTPAPVPPVDIALYWSDEELCLHLDKLIRGYPLPKNVCADVNPYQHKPSYLPDGIWYFIRSEDRKGTEYGFWKAKGEVSEIFSNSAITGWRTTFEFHEGQAPERKTNWVMQEYKITWKGQYGNSKLKESGSLCRVFQSDGYRPNHETPSVLKAVETSGQGSISESQVNERGKTPALLAVAETLQNLPVENLDENDLEDYLALDDLATPLSPFSSPDNLSCRSFSSDEGFNPVSLLKDLEDETYHHLQGNNANFKFSVSASVRPNEVVMPPATSGPLINGGRGKSPTAETLKVEYSLPGAGEGVQKSAIKSQNAELRSESALKFHKGASSSSTNKRTSEKEKKGTVGGMKKLKRKYLCFMPF